MNIVRISVLSSLHLEIQVFEAPNGTQVLSRHCIVNYG
ncbi:hypothetical protein ACHAW6_000242, partial [Cyclotella cf. meneghiniana]